MSNETQVDVLAVLDKYVARHLEQSARNGTKVDHALRESRLAVAELIEAANGYFKQYGNCGAPIQQLAADRLTAALARVGGAP